jgi:hypothetical protein
MKRNADQNTLCSFDCQSRALRWLDGAAAGKVTIEVIILEIQHQIPHLDRSHPTRPELRYLDTSLVRILSPL